MPHNIEESSPTDSNGSDVEGNNCICQTISTAKLTNVGAGMEDTDLDIAKPMPGPNSEDDDYEDPRVEENVKRRSKRLSAQEAAKKLKSDFAVPSGDDGQGPVPDVIKSQGAPRTLVVTLISEEEEEPIRYFVFCFFHNLIILFHNCLYFLFI